MQTSVDEVVIRLRKNHKATTEGFRQTSKDLSLAVLLSSATLVWSYALTPTRWGKLAETPLWLSVETQLEVITRDLRLSEEFAVSFKSGQDMALPIFPPTNKKNLMSN